MFTQCKQSILLIYKLHHTLYDRKTSVFVMLVGKVTHGDLIRSGNFIMINVGYVTELNNQACMLKKLRYIKANPFDMKFISKKKS